MKQKRDMLKAWFVVFVYHISPHCWTANLHFLVLLLNKIAAICRWMAGNIESSGSCLHKSASIWRFSCDRALLQRLHPFVLHAMWILDDYRGVSAMSESVGQMTPSRRNFNGQFMLRTVMAWVGQFDHFDVELSQHLLDVGVMPCCVLLLKY